jgi:hypothetical protein
MTLPLQLLRDRYFTSCDSRRAVRESLRWRLPDELCALFWRLQVFRSLVC